MVQRNDTKEKCFTVVMRGPSAVVFGQNENLRISSCPAEIGPVDIVCASRWLRTADHVIVPGHLWIEIQGKGTSLERSLAPYANASIGLVPVLALSANAAVGDVEIEVAFESTPNVSEREYFQSYVAPESPVMHFTRQINAAATVALLDAIRRHSDTERLQRAAGQYQLALGSWKRGGSTLFMAHLWMALEALTEVKIRAECTARCIGSKKELADSLGVEVRKLDSVIREELLLKGDAECYKRVKDASDGFEHGYLGYDRIHELADSLRYRMAKHVRSAIIELSGVGEETMKALTAEPFDKPIGYWPVIKYIKGRLLGDGSHLAADGNAYPFIRWKSLVTKCDLGENGAMDIQFNENFTAELAKGISLQLSRCEMWKPE